MLLWMLACQAPETTTDPPLPWTVPEAVEICHDGIDNERDGLVDCEDADCTDECSEQICDDNVDDDDDGRTDCDDPECWGTASCPPRVAVQLDESQPDGLLYLGGSPVFEATGLVGQVSVRSASASWTCEMQMNWLRKTVGGGYRQGYDSSKLEMEIALREGCELPLDLSPWMRHQLYDADVCGWDPKPLQRMGSTEAAIRSVSGAIWMDVPEPGLTTVRSFQPRGRDPWVFQAVQPEWICP